MLRAPLAVDGSLPPRAFDELDQQLDAGLGRIDARVERIEAPADCTDATCLAEHARAAGARYVVQPRVRVVERDYTITIDLIGAENGATLATVVQTCEVCGVHEAAQTLGDVTATVGSKLEALQLGPAILEIHSTPGGAVIELDGEPVGRAPVERQLEEGEHWISARLEGYVTQRRQVRAVAGVRESLELQLAPVPVEAPTGPGRLEIAGWSLLGIGAAGIATGAVLIVLEERPNRAQCSGDDVDPLGNCRLRYATLEPGIGTIAAGGAIAIAGLTMALVGRRRRVAPKTTAWLTPWSLGIRGRF